MTAGSERPRVAFLTIRNMDGYVSDDELVREPLSRRGYDLEVVPWDSETDWSRFRAVLLRTTWDYHDRLDEFLGVLETIESSGCELCNPREVVRWNADKRYLGELGDRGVPVVPTFYREANANLDLEGLFSHFQTHEVIVKPTVGACAFDTFRVRNERVDRGVAAAPSVDRAPSSKNDASRSEWFGGTVPHLPFTNENEERIEAALRGRPYMVQPFVPEILSSGETSLFFFDGRYSHSVLKMPKSGDFRVQEEYGGLITPADPPRDLVEACGAIAGLFDPPLLYARVDIVRTGELFVLMELELIEPALYFRIVPGAAETFADAIARRLDHE
ncbi:MAG: hypothetical protein R3E97_01180 [Candidatus Eisenbacteria bacterium]